MSELSLKDAFLGARERPPAERAAWLARLPPALAAEVQALLVAAEASDGPLQEPPPAAERFVDPSGRYHALEVLGEGGMGVVYRGQRADGEYRQEVAIKSLAGAGTRIAVARSRRERQLLARLTHPHIARLLDGGRDARGVPFLVMELVDGVPIDRWCAAHRADLRRRVGLIVAVAEAVAHAHRQLVVHLDLKPTNILIDRQGQPKLLDFGIARALDEDGEHTGGGLRPLTLRYASPEQVAGEAVGVTSDVYSLGVILYELVVGESPYGAAVEDPTRLPQAVRDAAVRPPRAVLPGARRRALRGELDAILLRALARAPQARYPTAEAFAADLRAFLDGRAVSARRHTWRYRWTTVWRRHWPWLGGLAAVLALTLFYGYSLRQQWLEVTYERDRARAVADFFVRMFDAVEPKRVVAHEASALELLEKAVDELDRAGLHGIPSSARPELLQAIGVVYYKLSLLDRAEAQFRRALAERAQSAVDDPRGRASTLNALATVVRLRGQLAEAEQLVDQAIEARRQAGDETSAEYANLLNSRAILQDQLGRRGEAIRSFEAADRVYRRLAPRSADLHAGVLNNHATLLYKAGDYAGCQARNAEAIEILGRAVRPDHPRFVDLYSDLALCELARGDLEGAERHFERAVTLGRRVYAANDLVLARVIGESSLLHRARGDLPAALAAIEQALAVLEPALGSRSPTVIGLYARREEFRAAVRQPN